MAPAPAAAQAAHRKRRRAPAADADAGDDDLLLRPAEAAAGNNKKSRFYYENQNNTLLTEPDIDNNNVLHSHSHSHSHIIVDDDDGDYETVEEDYEFDDIDDYDILDHHSDGLSIARDRCTGETVSIRRVHVLPCTAAAADDDSSLLLRAAVREAACLAACRGHPSVLQLRTLAAADETTGDLFVVTEAPPAGATTLRTQLLLRRRRGFSEAEARKLMKQLLGAAAMMHGAGVAHRDINPDNILVGGGPNNGDLKITGFGCATAAMRHGEEESPPPPPPPPMGSMRYRSPEQLYGVIGGGGGVPSHHGPEGDVWALGCVMAELLLAGGGGLPLFAAAAAETEEAEVLERAIELRDEIVTMGVVEAFDDVFGGTEVLSVAGRELLAGLLEFDDWERVTAAEALRHRWFNEEDDDVRAKGLVSAVCVS